MVVAIGIHPGNRLIVVRGWFVHFGNSNFPVVVSRVSGKRTVSPGQRNSDAYCVEMAVLSTLAGQREDEKGDSIEE
jgi:hypothetical protein